MIIYTNATSMNLPCKAKAKEPLIVYARCLRKTSEYFDCCPDQLTKEQLKTYFIFLAENKSWSMVKVARNAIQFCYRYVLGRPWEWVDIVKPPKIQTLQDILSLSEVNLIINQTQQLRYQTYFFVTYSLGLRLSEALNLSIADIDKHLMRVHIRQGKGKKDRFVPLPLLTLKALRRYWATHRHESLIFPGGQSSHHRQGNRGLWTEGALKKPSRLSPRHVASVKTFTSIPCAILLQHTYSKQASTFALFRLCWVTQALKPPPSTQE